MAKREKVKISGIYAITNVQTGEVYIGGSRSIKARFSAHLSALRNKTSLASQPLLLSILDKRGRPNLDLLKFQVLEECRPALLNERESYWTNHYFQNGKIFNKIWSYTDPLTGITTGGAVVKPKRYRGTDRNKARDVRRDQMGRQPRGRAGLVCEVHQMTPHQFAGLPAGQQNFLIKQIDEQLPNLTDRQRQIIELFYGNVYLTQIQISDALQLGQPTIIMSLLGSYVYRQDGTRTRHGGAIHRIKGLLGIPDEDRK